MRVIVFIIIILSHCVCTKAQVNLYKHNYALLTPLILESEKDTFFRMLINAFNEEVDISINDISEYESEFFVYKKHDDVDYLSIKSLIGNYSDYDSLKFNCYPRMSFDSLVCFNIYGYKGNLFYHFAFIWNHQMVSSIENNIYNLEYTFALNHDSISKLLLKKIDSQTRLTLYQYTDKNNRYIFEDERNYVLQWLYLHEKYFDAGSYDSISVQHRLDTTDIYRYSPYLFKHPVYRSDTYTFNCFKDGKINKNLMVIWKGDQIVSLGEVSY